jgi:hypothetical protein
MDLETATEKIIIQGVENLDLKKSRIINKKEIIVKVSMIKR